MVFVGGPNLPHRVFGGHDGCFHSRLRSVVEKGAKKPEEFFATPSSGAAGPDGAKASRTTAIGSRLLPMSAGGRVSGGAIWQRSWSLSSGVPAGRSTGGASAGGRNPSTATSGGSGADLCVFSASVIALGPMAGSEWRMHGKVGVPARTPEKRQCSVLRRLSARRIGSLDAVRRGAPVGRSSLPEVGVAALESVREERPGPCSEIVEVTQDLRWAAGVVEYREHDLVDFVQIDRSTA